MLGALVPSTFRLLHIFSSVCIQGCILLCRLFFALWLQSIFIVILPFRPIFWNEAVQCDMSNCRVTMNINLSGDKWSEEVELTNLTLDRWDGNGVTLIKTENYSKNTPKKWIDSFFMITFFSFEMIFFRGKLVKWFFDDHYAVAVLTQQKIKMRSNCS